MIKVKVDTSQVRLTAKDGPRQLHDKLEKAVLLSTLLVLAEAQNIANWGKAPANNSGKSVVRATRNVKNMTDRLRAITGMLLRSYTRAVEKHGPGHYVGIVGSPLVYARIHELGGWAGKGHAVYLRPRPVLMRALEAKRSTIMRLLNAAAAP